MKTIKPTKEDAMQESARKVLESLPRVKVEQCMYVSLDSLNASPVRVYVEANQKALKEAMPEPAKPAKLDSMSFEQFKETVIWQSYLAHRANWKESMQLQSAQLMQDAAMLLTKAGIKFKAVKDYGWSQLTILPVA